MRILIDTDVILDVALDRAPFAEESGLVLDWAERHPGAAGVAWHTVANVAYLLKQDARPFLSELLDFVVVAQTSTEEARQAIALPMADLEDALQAVAALRFQADHVVTRNIKEYRHAPLSAITPGEFLSLLG